MSAGGEAGPRDPDDRRAERDRGDRRAERERGDRRAERERGDRRAERDRGDRRAERDRGGRSAARDVVRLAWPSALSYLLTNSYRINDQFWIQGLGASAQAAIAATFFVALMSTAAAYLSAGGALPLVAQKNGARALAERDSLARHAIALSIAIGLALTLVGPPLVGGIVGLLGLSGEVAAHAREFLLGIFLCSVPLALTPTVDAIFLGLGNTRIPMLLQVLAVALNWLLNPFFIYGSSAAEHMAAPGAGLASALAGALGFEGLGMLGAAVATGISRAAAVSLGLVLLRTQFDIDLLGSRRAKAARFAALLRIAIPFSASVALYAAVYWALFALVLSRLGPEVMAGLGIGFQVFEGLSFPCYFALGMATASLVGNSLGARDVARAWAVVRASRAIGLVLGLIAGAAFLSVARLLVPSFSADPAVRRETLLYVGVLAFSQPFVAMEAVHEKALLGAGRTKAILLGAGTGNLLRLPLAWYFGIHAGLGAAAVYWTINATSVLKASLFVTLVQRGRWTDAARAPDE